MPRHSVKVPLGKRWPARDGDHLPSDFAECLTDGTRQIFFKKLILPSVSLGHSANFFFNFLKLILPSASVRHSAIFFYFWKSTLPSAPMALGNLFLFYFGPKFFSVALWQYFKLYFKIWGNFDFFWYISLVYFVSSNFSGYFKFELQVHGIMEFGHPKIVLMIFRVWLGHIQELTWNLEHLVDVTCRGTCQKCDFKLYKMQTKSENHETCRGIVLSHVEAVVTRRLDNFVIFGLRLHFI